MNDAGHGQVPGLRNDVENEVVAICQQLDKLLSNCKSLWRASLVLDEEGRFEEEKGWSMADAMRLGLSLRKYASLAARSA
jgi:hypothetical protein